MASLQLSRARVLVVDRDSDLRAGVVCLLNLDPDFEVVGVAANLPEAAERAIELAPDIILAEIDLPHSDDARGVVAALRAAAPRSYVVVLSHLDGARAIRAAIAAGARGYIVKYGTNDDLLTSLRATRLGARLLCAVATDRLTSHHTESTPNTAAGGSMTRREREILTLIAAGESNKQMAARLKLSVKTVEKHRANLIRKTGFNRIAALTRFAMRNGFVALTGEHVDECQPAGTAHPDAAAHARWRPVITNGGPLAGCALKHSACPHFHLIDRRMKSVTPGVDRRVTARAPAG